MMRTSSFAIICILFRDGIQSTDLSDDEEIDSINSPLTINDVPWPLYFLIAGPDTLTICAYIVLSWQFFSMFYNSHLDIFSKSLHSLLKYGKYFAITREKTLIR